jgi:homocysteine S-methyltransferase
VEEAAATGLETWLSLTAGPRGALLSPAALARAGQDAVRAGASIILVNCTPAVLTLPYVQALSAVVPVCGAYANAGNPQITPAAYANLAEMWVAAGATVLGSCCGTTPSHIQALKERFIDSCQRTRGG